jgi:hypothetical protein
MVVSARETGGTTVMHENADEVRHSRGVLLPFSQRQFLFRFIPHVGLLSHSGHNVDHILRQDSSFKVARLCLGETDPSKYLGRRNENWWRRERARMLSRTAGRI